MARRARTSSISADKPANEQSATRLRILLAAEKLFGEHGIDGVSLRQIRMEAQAQNSSAVQYHFSDRDDLVRAILSYRVAQMEPIRALMLQDIVKQNKVGDPEALMSVICLPQLALTGEDGRYPYVRFTAEYLTRHRAKGIAHPGDISSDAPALHRTMELLYTAMFVFDRDIALMRITGATLLFLNLIVQHDLGLSFNDSRPSIEIVTGEAIAMAVAALQAPPSGALRDRYSNR